MSIYKGSTQLGNALKGSSNLSGIYLGDKKVWPTNVDFYYDFRGKTLDQVKSAGRYVVGGDQNVYLDSGGYRNRFHSEGDLAMDFDFSNAKKITIEALCYHINGSWNGIFIFSVAGYYTFGSGHFDGSYSGYGIVFPSEGYSDTSVAIRGSYATGDYTIKTVRDLQNKLCTLTGFPYTLTRQLSDANVNEIRQGSTIELQSLSPQTIRTIKITIE